MVGFHLDARLVHESPPFSEWDILTKETGVVHAGISVNWRIYLAFLCMQCLPLPPYFLRTRM